LVESYIKLRKIIETSVGMVRGYIDGDLKAFKGIPYAERLYFYYKI